MQATDMTSATDRDVHVGCAQQPEAQIAVQVLDFSGPNVYRFPLPGTGCGLVLDDDGQSAYLHVTNETHTYVFQSLHLYDRNSRGQLFAGEPGVLVWHRRLKKAGLFYHGAFQAVVDFANRRAICRRGEGAQAWDDCLVEGLA